MWMKSIVEIYVIRAVSAVCPDVQEPINRRASLAKAQKRNHYDAPFPDVTDQVMQLANFYRTEVRPAAPWLIAPKPAFLIAQEGKRRLKELILLANIPTANLCIII